MAEHSLAIDRFHTRLALAGLREDAPPLRQEVTRTVRDLLPGAAGMMLEPLLGSRGGVLRIDRIALKLRLRRDEISARRLADRLARQLAEAVAERADACTEAPRIGAGLAFWPDHASYAASYLALRLRLAPGPEWAFPDFHALAHLAADEATLELVAAQPAILAALARLVGVARAPALAARLAERTAAALLERLLAGPPAELTVDTAAALAAMLDGLPPDVESAPAVVAVAAATAALAARTAALAAGTAADAAAVRQAVMLARLAVALAAVRAAAHATWGRAPVAADLAPAALVHLPEPARRLARAAVAPLTGAVPARALLAGLLLPRSRRPAAPAAPAPAAAAVPSHTLTSHLAGIGLLLPAAVAHGLPERLTAVALNRTLAAAAGPEVDARARLDPLLAALAPFDPNAPEPVFPPVPAALRAVVPETRRDGAAEAEGAAGWAACLIHAFAAGLRGFEASSLPYLRRQFLRRPGTLHIAEGRLTLMLDPLPLGILLRLAGLHRWSGRLPQVQGAVLRIEIRED
jgi:hypothetical protein